MGLDPKLDTPLRYSKECSEADRGALLAEDPFWPGWVATTLLMLAVVGSFFIEPEANVMPVTDETTYVVSASSRTKQDDPGETGRPTGSRLASIAAPSYGAENTNSRITLHIHRPTQVVVLGRRGELLFQRSLQRYDTYRVPELPDLTVTTQDAGAVEVIFDGQSVGFLGRDGAVVQRVPLSRFAPFARLNEADQRAMALEAFERAMAAKEAARRSDEASAMTPSAP